LQVAPALDLGLISVLREARKILRRKLFGGRALPSEFLADERVSGHGAIKAPRAAVGKLIADVEKSAETPTKDNVLTLSLGLRTNRKLSRANSSCLANGQD
jgi:hypothetical protein